MSDRYRMAKADKGIGEARTPNTPDSRANHCFNPIRDNTRGLLVTINCAIKPASLYIFSLLSLSLSVPSAPSFFVNPTRHFQRGADRVSDAVSCNL